LISKAKIDCIEQQRLTLAAINGLAGIELIFSSLCENQTLSTCNGNEIPKGSFDAEDHSEQRRRLHIERALAIYREALELIEVNRPEIPVDHLQKIHSLHNAAKTLQKHHCSVLDVSGKHWSADELFRLADSTSQDFLKNVTHQIESDSISLKEMNEETKQLLNDVLSDEEEKEEVCIDRETMSSKPMENLLTATSNKGSGSLAIDEHGFEAKSLKTANRTTTSISSKKAKTNNVEDLSQLGNRGLWFDQALTLLSYTKNREGRSCFEEFSGRVQEELAIFVGHRKARGPPSLWKDARDVHSFRIRLLAAFSELIERRTESLNAIWALVRSSSESEITSFYSCPCWRKSSESSNRKRGTRCPFCETEYIIQNYEGKLFFSFKERKNKLDWGKGSAESNDEMELEELLEEGRRNDAASEEMNSGRARRRQTLQDRLTRSASEFECVLRSLSWSLSKAVPSTEISRRLRAIQDRSMLTRRLLDSLKRELLQTKRLWRATRELAASRDELAMSLITLAWRVPGAPEESWTVPVFEVSTRQAQLSSERAVAEFGLQRAISRLRYLNNLGARNVARASHDNRIASRDQNDSSESTNVVSIAKEPCPVCHENIGLHAVIFPCGHFLCDECVLLLINSKKTQDGFKCPSCRALVNKEELSFVMEEASHNDFDTIEFHREIPVKGSYGTKMEAVIRQLILLSRNEIDTPSKTLVFSEWNDVLEVLSRALRDNAIPFCRVTNKASFHKTIDTFKREEQFRVLLLPIRTGSNGLNLIEATNVFLVEPLLNPFLEQQAINRVHRIGQTKETFIYRFIIRDTIEEKILEFTRQKLSVHPWREGNQSKDIISVDEIKNLFEGKIGTDLDFYPEQEHFSNAKAEVSLPNHKNSCFEQFWEHKIVLNNTLRTRKQAAEYLERQYSWECKEGGMNMFETENSTILMGRKVHSEVARRLIRLPCSEDFSDSEEVISALNEFRNAFNITE